MLPKFMGLEQPQFYWHLELSKKCALKCPRCPRTEYPQMYSPTELNLQFVQKILPVERLRSSERILLCGGEGDRSTVGSSWRLLPTSNRRAPRWNFLLSPKAHTNLQIFGSSCVGYSTTGGAA
jgi:hypothetical protein